MEYCLGLRSRKIELNYIAGIIMTKPTFEQYQKGATSWKREHKNIAYRLSHHGISEYSPQGTWCFYIYIRENMFLNYDDFNLFYRALEICEMGSGTYWETHDYGSVPDYGFHSGITWYEINYGIDKFTGKPIKVLEIGCDYAHLWDRESGYWQGLDDVDADAKRLIDKLVEAHPLKSVCGYSGKLGNPEEFYTAKNGRTVHKSYLEKLKSGNNNELWLPEEIDGATEKAEVEDHAS